MHELVHFPNPDIFTFIEQVEAPKKGMRSKSLYAKVTDTGVDPAEAAKRLNLDWDSAADIQEEDDEDEVEVPPVLVCFCRQCSFLFLKLYL